MQIRSPDIHIDADTDLGECPIWDETTETLSWIDLHRGLLCRSAGDAGQIDTVPLPKRIGAFGLRRNSGEVLGLEDGFYLRSAETGNVDLIAEIEPDLPTTRLNDGRIAPDGSFICGGMDEADPQKPISSVYRLDGSGAVTTVISDVYCANALCFSPDGGTMYFTNMATRTLVAYEYVVGTGPVGAPRLIAELAAGSGLYDGAAVDETGAIWVAVWGGRRLLRYTPDGSLDQQVEMPVTNPTCCVFGGADFKTLFITTAQFGLTKEQRAKEPLAGAILSIDLPVGGLPEHRFEG
ncbi:L-arabinonolactonase [Aliiruegeria haliotis]|uniref:L-arabinonolactonase n=1 Tax=Aliiruegeria haliotis TaxID=1280846 RepID=A0A2T0REV4_9RHOB|nr:SMP-30/gluconolactonase/LRE family protein [Aliiruegeria haliotis]PRY19669.1 L-arabinonolactonase [Aliiruegeria haliotis]